MPHRSGGVGAWALEVCVGREGRHALWWKLVRLGDYFEVASGSSLELDRGADCVTLFEILGFSFLL